MSTPVANRDCRSCTPVRADIVPGAGHQPDPVAGLFASQSVPVHVLRGLLGLVFAVAALGLAQRSPAALLLLLPAVLAWRGCPTCWALGLIETRRRSVVRRHHDERWS